MHEHRLRDILGRLGVGNLEVSPSGWLHGVCPLAQWTHSGGRDRRPSFGVKPDPGGGSGYVCFTCRYKGRVSSLIRVMHHLMELTGINVSGLPALAREADMADWEGMVETPYEIGIVEPSRPEPLEEAAFGDLFMPAWEVPEARAYLEGRGVGEATSISLELGWDPSQARVVFPIRDGEGRLYGYTGRAVREGSWNKVRDYPGLPKRWLILGQHRWEPCGYQILPSRKLVLVEGLFGYAHLVEMGLEHYADVGAVMGTSFSHQKIHIIRDRVQQTYLFIDNDEAGEQCLFGRMGADGVRDFHNGVVSILLSDVSVFVPAWPEDKTDPEDLTREEVWHMLRDTPSYPRPGV